MIELAAIWHQLHCILYPYIKGQCRSAPIFVPSNSRMRPCYDELLHGRAHLLASMLHVNLLQAITRIALELHTCTHAGAQGAVLKYLFVCLWIHPHLVYASVCHLS